MCRCGYDGVGDHPCHGRAYSCKRPASQRFYDPRPVSLAGVQMKFQVSDTWACNDCWTTFALVYLNSPEFPSVVSGCIPE